MTYSDEQLDVDEITPLSFEIFQLERDVEYTEKELKKIIEDVVISTAIIKEQEKYLSLIKRIIGNEVKDDFSYRYGTVTNREAIQHYELSLKGDNELDILELFTKYKIELKRNYILLQSKEEEVIKRTHINNDMYLALKDRKEKMGKLQNKQ